jgi:hypothetical protein
MSPSGEKLVPAAPPSPVAGAPKGIIVAPAPESLDVVGLVDVPGLADLIGVVVPPGFVPLTGAEGPVAVVTTGIVVVVVGAVVLVVVVVVVGVAGGVTLGAAHVAIEMVLVSRVTAPFWAMTLPSTEASVVRVMSVSARMLPTKVVEVPRVAELPTVQKTLQACAPFSRITELEDAVVSVEAAWKMNTALGSPPPSRVRAPFN